MIIFENVRVIKKSLKQKCLSSFYKKRSYNECIFFLVLLLVAECNDFSHMPVMRTLVVHSPYGT